MLTSSYNTSSVFVCLPVCVCLFPLFTIIWLPCFYVFILFRRNTRARAHTHTRRRISIRNSLHIVLSVKQLQMSRQQQRREEKNAKKTSKLINKSFVWVFSNHFKMKSEWFSLKLTSNEWHSIHFNWTAPFLLPFFVSLVWLKQLPRDTFMSNIVSRQQTFQNWMPLWNWYFNKNIGFVHICIHNKDITKNLLMLSNGKIIISNLGKLSLWLYGVFGFVRALNTKYAPFPHHLIQSQRHQSL